MMHAERFSNAGKWTDAMKAYRFAMAEFPNNAAAIIGFGRVALASGQTDLARKAFTQAVKINPTNLEALGYMGDIQERMGQLDAAAETYLRMGNVYASRNELDSAIDTWHRATGLVSDHIEIHRKLADALTQQGKIRPAAREYLALAAIYQRRQDLEQAMNYIDSAQNLVSDDPGILAALQAIQSDKPIQPNKISDTPPQPEPMPDDFAAEFGGSEEDPFGLDDLFGTEVPEEKKSTASAGLVEEARQNALEQLANVIFENGDQPGAMVIMQALDLQSRDSIVEAINNYRQALDLGSKQPALYFNLGLLYKQQGQLNEAAEMLKQSAQHDEYNISSLFALGETYYAAKDFNEAITHFVEAIKLIDLPTVSGQRYYEVAQTYSTLVNRYVAQGDHDKINKFINACQNFFSSAGWERKVDEARQRMNNVSEEGHTMSLAEFLETPETEVIVTTLAVTGEYMSRNMMMTASEECLRAIQKAPAFLPLHVRLADILLKQERTDEAISKYLYIARVFQMRGQPEQTVNIYSKILKLAPMDVTVRSKLINLYTSLDDLNQALEQYLVLADSYYQLAQVDRALEKYREALKLSEQVSNSDNLRVEALTRTADIYNQRFDWAGATSALKGILEINPDDEQTLRQLIELYYKQNKAGEAANILDKLLARYQRHNPTKALELLRDLVGSYPDDMSLRQRLAVAYAQNNRKKQAIAEYDNLCEMQMENGLRDQAIQTIQAIIHLGPDDVEGYHRLLKQIGGAIQ